MDVSEFILNYLIKESGANISVPLEESARFKLYGELIKTVDIKNISNTYVRSENTYLHSQLLKNNIVSVADISQNITALVLNPAFCRADALLNNMSDLSSDICLFGGTALKKQYAENMNKPFFVTAGGNLLYKGIINCAAPIAQNKITSEFTKKVMFFYRCAAEVAIKGQLQTLVVPEIKAENIMVKNHIANIAVWEIKRATPRTKVLLTVNEDSLAIYKKYIGEL